MRLCGAGMGGAVDIEALRERARIIRRARAFFDGRGYLELDTPILAPDLIPESCLEVFETRRILPSGAEAPCWLVPSPEIWMKKVIARHRASAYQICKCFRNGESSGRLHSPEFTMLEYYTMGAGCMDSLDLTEELLARLSEGLECEGRMAPFERVTMDDAFRRHAGFGLFAAAAKPGELEAHARRLGLEPRPGEGAAALFDLIFVHAVEPALRESPRPVALLEYPAFAPCLALPAAPKPGAGGAAGGPAGGSAERWELYFRGIELANCFSEETDAGRVRAFFEGEAREKERRALVRHAVDGDYWKIFGGPEPFPRCSGVAMGMDRLIMALLGKSSIDAVLPFPMGG